MRICDIIPVLESIAPLEYAVPGDKIGLQVGDPNSDVKRIIVTVDATPRVIEEARRRSAEFIVAHHPLIFNPLCNLRSDIYPQSLVYALAKSGIGFYAMHTNFDCAEGGINDALAERLGVVDTQVLESTYTENLYKLVTFVPEEAISAVDEALSDAGAGIIGDYSNCAFQTHGTGTFMPLQGAKPYVGNVCEMEKVPEIRLEMQVSQRNLKAAIEALLGAHPYEEVAYDIYPLLNPGKKWGLGRFGRLRNPMTFDGFCELVRDVLDVEDIRVSGNPDSMVEKVALLGGSGGDKLNLAHSLGADVFVTGDVKHSQFLHAQALGLNLIDATHFFTERPGMISLVPKLHELLSADGVMVEYVDEITLNGG